MQAGSRPRMDAMDYPTKERKICPKCIKSREKAIVSNKNSWDPSTQCCFYFWPVSFSSQCCSPQLTHQMLHARIGRVRRQLSVSTVLTKTGQNVQSSLIARVVCISSPSNRRGRRESLGTRLLLLLFFVTFIFQPKG